MRRSVSIAIAITAGMTGGCATATHQPALLKNVSTLPGGQADVVGPIAFRCESIDAPVNATFFNGPAGSVRLVWPGHDITLPQGLSADGGRYAGTAEGGQWEFWNKGQGAMFTRPGAAMINCSEVPGQ